MGKATRTLTRLFNARDLHGPSIPTAMSASLVWACATTPSGLPCTWLLSFQSVKALLQPHSTIVVYFKSLPLRQSAPQALPLQDTSSSGPYFIATHHIPMYHLQVPSVIHKQSRRDTGISLIIDSRVIALNCPIHHPLLSVHFATKFLSLEPSTLVASHHCFPPHTAVPLNMSGGTRAHHPFLFPFACCT